MLEAVADAEGLAIDEAELREEIERAVQGGTDPARMARQALARPETRARVQAILKSRKAVGRLVELSGGAAPPDVADDAPEASAAATAASEDASAASGEPSSTSDDAPPTSGEHHA